MPIESWGSPCAAASSRRAAKWGRLASGILGERRHGHQAGDRDGAALEEGGQRRPGRSPPCPPRPRRRPRPARACPACRGARAGGAPSRRRRSGSSSTQREHLLDLAALELADEVPAEAIAGGRLLGLELLRAVLAEQLEAGLGERAEILGRHVLHRREQLDVVRIAAGAAGGGGDLGAHPVGVGADARAAQRPPRHARLAPGHPAVAAVREEQRGIRAHGAQPRVVDRGHAGLLQLGAGDGLEGEAALPAAGVVRREAPRAPPPPPRSSSRAPRARAPRCTGPAPPTSRSARTPSATMPPASPRQPPWSIATAPSATSATGRQSAVNTSAAAVGQRGRLPVLLLGRAVGGGRLGGAPHARAVDLAAVQEALARHADGGGEPLAVGVDVRAGRRPSGARGSARRTARPTRRRAGWRRAPGRRRARRRHGRRSQRNGGGSGGSGTGRMLAAGPVVAGERRLHPG